MDLESDDTICTSPNNNDSSLTDDIKTPTSTASSGKYAGKLKNWKIPKFMRKLSDQKQDLEVDVFTVSPLSSTEDGYQQVRILFSNLNNRMSNLFNISVTMNFDRLFFL